VGITDKMLGALGKVTGPARQQTISDDARSRVARRQQADYTRLTREELDSETGKPLRWFKITMSSFGGYPNVPISWQAVDEDEARESFIEWLGEKEFQTVDFVNDGQHLKVTGRGSWVAGFTMDGKPRTRPL
jgi:hypothetical protein